MPSPLLRSVALATVLLCARCTTSGLDALSNGSERPASSTHTGGSPGAADGAAGAGGVTASTGGGGGSVSSGGAGSPSSRSYTWNVSGSTPVMPDIQNLKVDFGRFYNAEDMQLRGRVCALGSEAKEKLFSGRFPLGERIRINGIPYEVVGVMKARPPHCWAPTFRLFPMSLKATHE